MVKDKLKLGRLMYMFEATLEYFISMLVAGTFLATLAKELGISDSLTGIISSFISLGCLFQLLSVFIRRKRMKRLVIVMSVANQTLFMLLYFLPLTSFSSTVKTILFVAIIVVAYVLYYIAHPKKINWMMSLVEDKHRGRFTANKEIFSLITGIIFHYAMGWLMDYFLGSGNKRMAFLVGGIAIFVIMISHTLTMIFTVEKEQECPKRNIKATVKEIFENKQMLKVTVIFVFYYIATYAVTPFFGTYIIGELGVSLQLAAALAMVGSISRILVSRSWGKYADKNGFAKMIEKCFVALALAYVCVIFAAPLVFKMDLSLFGDSTLYINVGAIMFALYYLLHGIGLGGINSALVNLVFDYVEPQKRADSLAVCQAAAGLVGFVSTICASPLVALVQSKGNSILGITVYAQQLLSAFGVVAILLAIVFVRKKLIKKG